MSNKSPEKISFGSPEQQSSPEALKQAGAERHRELRKENEERAGEQSHESIDEARQEVDRTAQRIEQEKSLDRQPLSPAEARRNTGAITKAKRDASFKATMNEVQDQMSAPSRVFSKVIHNKTVEKISDVTATTVARPNAILSGAIFAFLLTLAVYLIAKNLGYPLSGFETIGAFILGWVIGIIYDFLKAMITGRK